MKPRTRKNIQAPPDIAPCPNCGATLEMGYKGTFWRCPNVGEDCSLSFGFYRYQLNCRKDWNRLCELVELGKKYEQQNRPDEQKRKENDDEH